MFKLQISLDNKELVPRHGPAEHVQFAPYDGAPRTGSGMVPERVEAATRGEARADYVARRQ